MVLAAIVTGPVHAQVDNLTQSDHWVRLSDGKKLSYTVSAGRIPIRDGASEEVHGHMFFVAYRVASAKPRPVTFLWNGGPGSNSSTLHLESVGPQILGDAGGIVPFPDTALATTDLVFVDAVGTGFSRVAKPDYAKEFYQTRGDTLSFVEFVRAWRLLFAAEKSPLFIGGESWGGHRAAEVAHVLQDNGVAVDGIIIISGRNALPLSQPDNTLRALRTVEQALAALHHGRLSPALGNDPRAIERQVTAWVLETYAPALARLNTLTSAERDALAEKLALFTALPKSDIDRQTLIVTPAQFLRELLRDEKKILATNDMHRLDVPAYGDREKAVERYLRGALHYRTDSAYVDAANPGWSPDSASLQSVGDQWDYTKGYYATVMSADEMRASNAAAIARGEPPGGQDTPAGAEAMALNPAMRMLIAVGQKDSLMSCAATEETVRRQTLELQRRITFRCYDGGHMFYYYPDARRKFSADLQAFISGRTFP
ncbi:MAG TPA: hypothetical protein VF509_16705 [Sphingobium sp.]